MKLDRNINKDGAGKYALINMRKLQEYLYFKEGTKVQKALQTLIDVDVVELGEVGGEDEFFVIKLKDKFAAAALVAYANAASGHDLQYAKEVLDLSWRSEISNFKKMPD